jgi:hypothetical protein
MTTHSGDAVAEIFDVNRLLIMAEKFVFLNGAYVAGRRVGLRVLPGCRPFSRQLLGSGGLFWRWADGRHQRNFRAI